MVKPTDKIREAELLLKLYELRRESLMREARRFVGGEFSPQSAEDFVNIVTKGGKESGFVLQVYGYWDMVSAFVEHGALSERLVFNTCQEMYFQYAKIQPYLKEFRRRMNLPEFMQNLEKVVEASPQGRRRLSAMKGNLKRIAEVRQQKPALS